MFSAAFFRTGNPIFLDQLDTVTDPATLRSVARHWIADRSPNPRRLLLAYLERPLNCFHEPLILRLLRGATRQEDDEVMAGLLVLFDRSLRWCWALRKQQSSDGPPEKKLVPVLVPHPPLPRGKSLDGQYLVPSARGTRLLRLTDEQHRDYEAYRFFVVPTRRLLRRAVWRYFCRLAHLAPQRYVPALVPALKRYTDADVSDHRVFLDCVNLARILFRHISTLPVKRLSWTGRIVRSWLESDIPPAPAFEPLWSDQPEVLSDLMSTAQSQVVRTWAAKMLRRQNRDTLSRLPLAELLDQLSSQPTQRVHQGEFGGDILEVLRRRGGLGEVPISIWLQLLKGAYPPSPAVLEITRTLLTPETVSLPDTVDLCCSRHREVGYQAWNLLLSPRLPNLTNPDSQTVDLLLRVADAPIASLRLAMILGLRRYMTRWAEFQPRWLLRLLASKYQDVRTEGWDWFIHEPRASANIELWRKLVRSPFPDVREKFLRYLQQWQGGRPRVLGDKLPLDEEGLGALWARTLLPLHGPWRTRRQLAEQLGDRLSWRPEDAEALLPILAELVRAPQIREHSKPAWRLALMAVVRLVEMHPEWKPLVARELPELSLQDADQESQTLLG